MPTTTKQETTKQAKPKYQPQYATFGDRFFATIIDAVFFIALQTIFVVLIFPELNETSGLAIAYIVNFSPLILGGLIELFYINQRSQSVGKNIMNIQVVRFKDHSQRCSTFRYVVTRYISGKNLIIGLIPFVRTLVLPYAIINFLFFLFAKHHNSLHDRIADTAVIRLPAKYQAQYLLDYTLLPEKLT